MSSRPEIVCLCGSSRFRAEMRELHGALSLEGVIVLAPAEIDAPLSSAQRDALGALHRHRIDLADRVLVVNPGGYLGESTRAEIEYARATGTPVTLLVDDQG